MTGPDERWPWDSIGRHATIKPGGIIITEGALIEAQLVVSLREQLTKQIARYLIRHPRNTVVLTNNGEPIATLGPLAGPRTREP